MRKVLIGVLAAALTGCASLPFMASTNPKKASVQVEAKIIQNSGAVIPVPDTTFDYWLYDKAPTTLDEEAQYKERGQFKTDFDGRATIEASTGSLFISGYYSYQQGKSSVDWSRAQFDVVQDKQQIRLSNNNGKVTNR